MNRDDLLFWVTIASGACWIICFWWMHRISTRQDALLANLQVQNDRIEKLSKTEHDLIREVHPQVNEIKETVQEVALQVRDDGSRSERRSGQ
jgi:cell division protein FtsB